VNKRENTISSYLWRRTLHWTPLCTCCCSYPPHPCCCSYPPRTCCCSYLHPDICHLIVCLPYLRREHQWQYCSWICISFILIWHCQYSFAAGEVSRQELEAKQRRWTRVFALRIGQLFLAFIASISRYKLRPIRPLLVCATCSWSNHAPLQHPSCLGAHGML
jgi:hypothetical protein